MCNSVGFQTVLKSITELALELTFSMFYMEQTIFIYCSSREREGERERKRERVKERKRERERKNVCIFEILGGVNISGHWRP